MKIQKKRTKRFLRYFIVVFPLILCMTLITRTLPDGVVRLYIGESGIGEKAIAFTFEDGPTVYTEQLLDGLDEAGVAVSFFVVGQLAEKNPDIVKRAFLEGHLICNHTYSNSATYFTNPYELRDDIDKCSDVLEKIIGVRPLFFRAPQGALSFIHLKVVNAFVVHWSVDSYDYQGKSENYIYKRIIGKAADGEIFRFSDTNPETVNAVLKAIPVLEEQGFEIVRVDELLSRNGAKLKQGVAYRSCKYERGALAF